MNPELDRLVDMVAGAAMCVLRMAWCLLRMVLRLLGLALGLAALVGLVVGAVGVSPALIATAMVVAVARMLHPAVPLRDFFKTRRRRFTGLAFAAALLVQTGAETIAGGGGAAIASGVALCACAVWPALHVARVFVGKEMPGIFEAGVEIAEADAADGEAQS